MLEDVDRSRMSAQQAETALARERQQRIQSEEAAAQTLEVGRRTLREAQAAAQQMERELRDELGNMATRMAQTQSTGAVLQQRLGDIDEQLTAEKQAHTGTRALLAEALLAMRKPTLRRRAPPQDQGT